MQIITTDSLWWQPGGRFSHVSSARQVVGCNVPEFHHGRDFLTVRTRESTTVLTNSPPSHSLSFLRQDLTRAARANSRSSRSSGAQVKVLESVRYLIWSVSRHDGQWMSRPFLLVRQSEADNGSEVRVKGRDPFISPLH